MKKTLLFITVMTVTLWSGSLLAAARTWSGTISDSACGLSHAKMTDNGKKGSDKDCTAMCVLHGAKYVFVSDGKVLMIKNQDFAGLKQYAGDQVTLSGDRSGDTITVTKIVAAKRS
jgi:hypothetical protein